jgi:hypothetical protein
MKLAATLIFSVGLLASGLLLEGISGTLVQTSPDAAQTPYGKMDFATFRILTSGMTETEVLSRAGRPFHEEFLGCGHSVPVPWCPIGCVFCQTRWDYVGEGYSEDWIFEVKFLGGRVFETSNYRRTP